MKVVFIKRWSLLRVFAVDTAVHLAGGGIIADV